MRNEFGLSPNMLKLLYRGNFTFAQAALYLGVAEIKIKYLVDKGLLGTGKILEAGPTIPKAECDRFLRDNLTYQKNSKVEEMVTKLKLVTEGKAVQERIFISPQNLGEIK